MEMALADDHTEVSHNIQLRPIEWKSNTMLGPKFICSA
jgi:hypothetical protein